jgi:hypothetical protein
MTTNRRTDAIDAALALSKRITHPAMPRTCSTQALIGKTVDSAPAFGGNGWPA